MGFFGSVFDTVKNLSDDLLNECKKFTNVDLLEATIAACMWVSAADGELKSEEKQKMLGFIERSEALKHYARNKVVACANKWGEDFQFDVGIAEEHAKKAIEKVKDVDQARVLIKVCCAIGAADGDFDKSEKTVVRKVCNIVMLPPGEFGV